MTVSATPVRRSRFALRFSLRVLFIAFTAVSLGIPVWYRWPYEETVVEPPLPNDPFARFRTTVVLRITSWRRLWGGGRIKHGPDRTVENGKTTLVVHYRNGKLHGLRQSFDFTESLLEEESFRDNKKHGPYRRFYPSGTLEEEGHWIEDQKHGVWAQYYQDGSLKCRFTWKQGRLHGPATVQTNLVKYGLAWSDNQVFNYQLIYSEGRLVTLDGRIVDDPLGKQLVEGWVGSRRIVEVLEQPLGLIERDLPVSHIAQTISRSFLLPAFVDPLHVDPDLRVTINALEIDLASALAIMATNHDLACHFRYGSIWITSPDDANDWSDPTGVTDTAPSDGSDLELTWNEPVNVLVEEQPLVDVLEELAETVAIEIDVSQFDGGEEAARYPVSLELKEHPFRHVLGILLYKTRCRCRLEGEKLVILPPE